jgi:hypothetical protein
MSVESLTRWLNRVALGTVQLLLEGDNILAALSKAFKGPSTQGGPHLLNYLSQDNCPMDNCTKMFTL